MEGGNSVDISGTTSWSSTLEEEFKNIDLDHVHDYLSTKAASLNKRVKVLGEIETNNKDQKETVEDDKIGEFVAKSRLKRMNAEAEVLKNEDLLDYTPFLTHLQLDIVTEYKQEMYELENLLVKSKKELVDSKEELASLESKIRSLHEIMEKRKSEGEMMRDSSSEVLNKAVQQEFKKHQKEMKELVQNLYPEDQETIKDVIQRVIDKYFEDGEDYIQLSTRSDYPCLEFLFEACVLERHPYASNKIKLAKLVD